MLNDKIELTSRTTLHGIACYNVFQYLETVDGGATHLDKLLAAFRDDIVSLWVAWLSEQATISCLSATVVAVGPAAPTVLTLTSGNVGLIAGESLPANRVVCVADYSETYNPRGRGRKFYSGIPESSEADNCIDEATYDLIYDMADALTETLVSGGGGEWQRQVRSTADNADYPVITSIVRPEVATMRSRTTRLCG